MIRSNKSPFESGYGFKSPGFTVDTEGNLIAKSFNIQTSTTTGVFDFIITDDSASFSIQNYTGSNPTITVSRGNSYTFKLELTAFTFFIKKQDGITNQNSILTHSSGDVGEDAQGKDDGILSFNVPLDAEDTLFYTNADNSAIGTINVIDPVGLFSTIDITGNVTSTSPTTGSLTVDGGVGITGDLFLEGDLNLGGVGIPRLSSFTNLELNADNKIVLQISSTKIGEIDSSGLTIALNNSTINNATITSSLINNTVIGDTIPATASFTSATVSSNITQSNQVTSKNYVDVTVTALAIALGS